jgi:CheY-specific phosphatase CheX
MISGWQEVLKDVISDVLETMFFSMVEFGDCGPADGGFDFGSEIQLLNHTGRTAISLRVSEIFARMITANFLGIEESQVTDDDLSDSLKELANMVGGGYHARIKEAGWRLGMPKVWKIDPGSVDTTQLAGELDFGFFGEPAGSAVVNQLPD